jgi:hypothetical protein
MMNKNLAPILATGALLALAGCSQSDPGAEAYEACEQAVEVHFDSGDIYGFARLDQARISNVDEMYEVTSYISSTNGLGEATELDFTCQLERDGGDWKLVSLDLE